MGRERKPDMHIIFMYNDDSTPSLPQHYNYIDVVVNNNRWVEKVLADLVDDIKLPNGKELDVSHYGRATQKDWDDFFDAAMGIEYPAGYQSVLVFNVSRTDDGIRYNPMQGEPTPPYKRKLDELDAFQAVQEVFKMARKMRREHMKEQKKCQTAKTAAKGSQSRAST